MKVLFDTNVYVSESLVGGLAERIIESTIDARWRVFASTYLLDETERVLTEKLGFSVRFAKLARQRIWRRCESVVAPPSRHVVPHDPKDSPVLKAALAASADYLVSDDHHLLHLNPYEGLRIVSMRAFEEILRSEGLLPQG